MDGRRDNISGSNNRIRGSKDSLCEVTTLLLMPPLVGLRSTWQKYQRTATAIAPMTLAITDAITTLAAVEQRFNLVRTEEESLQLTF
jgi:hypothetical protein